MLDSVVLWLDQVSAQAFWTSVTALVAIDLVALLVVLQTRSRALVNRWTGPVLAANLLLLGAALQNTRSKTNGTFPQPIFNYTL